MDDAADHWPISWSHVVPRGDLYPFAVQANRPLTNDEWLDMVRFCTNTFGKGGKFPEPGNQWFGTDAAAGSGHGYFAFASEGDLTLFVVTFTR
mgnify:FL=1